MKKMLVALSFTFAAMSANASPLSFLDTSTVRYKDNNVVNCPFNNCVVAPTAIGSGSAGIAFGGDLSLSSSASLLFTYLGKENASTNIVIFDFNGVELFNTATTAVGTQVFASNVSAGTLVFKVTTNGLEIGDANLFLLGSLAANVHGKPLVIGLNDNTKASPTNGDTDIDDGVFSVQAVPVPAALPLLATAFGAFGIARRRNKAAA